MIRLLLCLILLPLAVGAQTREVDPADLTLWVTVENEASEIYPQEMVLITVNGVYRRHITLEKLEPPKLEGFNWLQLGEDIWFDSTLDGRRVKNFRRRMALYPQQSGELTIPPFTHHLQLVDEGDDWFPHDITSEPVTIMVAPPPPGDGWFFPVRRLTITDNWSNAPDQLAPGAGVLRIVRLEAVGVGPSMIPPMPELTSPSAMIFAHPEKRLVELSPEGPVSVAFWRWTIRPTNGTSAILEPFSFDYFDTVNRVARTATISAQRVAMADAPPVPPPAPPVRQRPGLVAAGAVLAGLAGLALLLRGRRAGGSGAWARWRDRRWPGLSPEGRALRRAAREGDLLGMRRAAGRLAARAPSADRTRLLGRLDTAIHGRDGALEAPVAFARAFLRARGGVGTATNASIARRSVTPQNRVA